MKDDNCIFCKLANGDIPSYTVYEDEDFRVILDLSPAADGHALILPKEHSTNVYELPDETAAKVFVLAKKIAMSMKESLQCDGINILQNNGKAAGQTVFHFHIHLIPRFEHDNVKITWKKGKVDEVQLKSLCEKIESAIQS